MTKGDPGRNSLRLMTAGVEFIGIFGMFLAIGILLDRWLGTMDRGAPFTVWGGVLGFAGAMRHLLRQVKSSTRKREEHDGPENDAT